MATRRSNLSYLPGSASNWHPLALIAAITVVILHLATPAHAFRCGYDRQYLASEGMHKGEIENNCGAPLRKEVVGADRRAGSIRIIEEWTYLIDEYGHKQRYLIRFDRQGIARKIEWLGEQKP